MARDAEVHVLEGVMRKIMSFGIVAVMVAAAITAWAATGPRTKMPEIPEIVAVGINPHALMKVSTGLQVEVWDWF
jgi:hypothetical protein